MWASWQRTVEDLMYKTILRITACSVTVSLAFLGACASLPVHQALSSETKQRITSTEVVAPVRQSEIYVYVPPSRLSGAGAAGGLVGVLVMTAVDASVDKVRSSKAEAAVKPLRN